MVIDPATATLVVGGISAATSGANMYAQGKMNRKTREWNEKMYAQQRQDALTDVATQNAYNHPLEQMNRLRQAGLNPNLVYGKGADNTSAQIRSSQAPSWNPQTPRLDMGAAQGALMQYQNIKQSQAQTDNIAEQTAVAKAQKLNIDASTARILQETATNKFQLAQAQRLSDLVFEKSQLDNSMLRQNMDLNLKNYDLSKMRTTADIKNTMQSIVESNQRIKTQQLQNSLMPYQRQKIEKEIQQLDIVKDNLRKEGELKDLDINLRRVGIMPSDPYYIRMMIQGLNKVPSINEGTIPEKSESQKLYDKYNKQGGLQGTKLNWDDYKRRYMNK